MADVKQRLPRRATAPSNRPRRATRSARVTAAYSLTLSENRRLHSGYLTKQGGKWKTWKLRWMVLTPVALTYYVNEEEKNEKGSIRVADITYVATNLGERTNCIELGTIGRAFFLSAESAADYEVWLGWLNLVCTVPPAPETHVACFKLFREGLEQGHAATTDRYKDPEMDVLHPFDALVDIGVPSLADILFPPISTKVEASATTLELRDARFSVNGSVSMRQCPTTGAWRVVAEDWTPSIHAFIESNGLNVDASGPSTPNRSPSSSFSHASRPGDNDDDDSS
ncbi:uncharacterized protein AMSG_07039 [Thecamonas trahens ATCC 50062]|uniref:PH domain-containing protein n=1 Tax=Thecamonas trahens ATCC 50062 TaxID=461836 RepID=A0A0L0DFW1_THETB|nr:hypothetical protein AMSG_07039 [Thecamonas trahens ATCC 50062]KNC51056.1 hypothetical protein AMSG_07039 [Thecamonas trahens ATCC 50062]|eukprot:XP_013756518.1 hypothetical protein AMSG_07039 [Thecamonas trahens ATCC 50062]